MAKRMKGMWAVTALVAGLGMGFTAGAREEAPGPTSQGLVECSTDAQCDSRCGAKGAGACQRGRCYCRF